MFKGIGELLFGPDNDGRCYVNNNIADGRQEMTQERFHGQRKNDSPGTKVYGSVNEMLADLRESNRLYGVNAPNYPQEKLLTEIRDLLKQLVDKKERDKEKEFAHNLAKYGAPGVFDNYLYNLWFPNHDKENKKDG